MVNDEDTEGIVDSLTSSTAVGTTPVTISLEAGVTLAIFGLSRPNILFIFSNKMRRRRRYEG